MDEAVEYINNMVPITPMPSSLRIRVAAKKFLEKVDSAKRLLEHFN